MRRKLLVLVLGLFVIGLMMLPQTIKGEEPNGIMTSSQIEAKLRSGQTVVLNSNEVPPEMCTAGKIESMVMEPKGESMATAWITGNTGSYGDGYMHSSFGHFTHVICGCAHMDTNHRVNACIEDGGNTIHVSSWTDYGMKMGPIWLYCTALLEY